MANEADIAAAQQAEQARINAEILGRGLPTVAVDPGTVADRVARDPQAYSAVQGMTKYDPAAYGKLAAELGMARGVGNSNGLILYTKPDKYAGYSAALLADAANRQGNQRLEDILSGKKVGNQSQVGVLGDLANSALEYMLKQLGTQRQGGQQSSLPTAGPGGFSGPVGGSPMNEQIPGMGGQTSGGGQNNALGAILGAIGGFLK